MKSYTLQKPISLGGIGLHTGESCNLTLNPANIKTGIIFNRTDCKTIVPAKWDKVISTKFSTNLAVNNIEVRTVEHLLSALAGLHIDNCEIEINNLEVPILDGSSKIFVDEILNAGLKELNAYQEVLEIKKTSKI